MEPILITAPFTSTSVILLCLILLVVGTLLHKYTPRRFPPNAPALVSERMPFLGSIRFFTARWDFLRVARAHSATGNFSFNIGKYEIVGLTGVESRKFFFENKKLRLAEAYMILFNAAPPVRSNDEDPNVPRGFPAYFTRTLVTRMKPEILERYTPKYVSDIRYQLDRMALTSRKNIIQPFESIYEIIFQLTMRTVGCEEIAGDPALLSKILRLFEGVEASSTPTTLLFPRLPSPALFTRYWNSMRMYVIFKRIVDERKRTGHRKDDCLQFLIDQGDDIVNIIMFVQGALFAAQLNSGISAAYVITCLARYPEWRQKCREELVTFASRYTTDASAPLLNQLKDIPHHVWEAGFPLSNLCFKESIRLQLFGSLLRRNVSGKDIEIPGSAAKSPIGKSEFIPNGAIVTYPIADVHHDPAIYKDPEVWDPARYMEGREEDKKSEYAWLGWGAGKHICLGMRFAKLEQSLILAHFLAKFDFWLVNEQGLSTNQLPHLNINATAAEKPKDNVYVRFAVREK